VPFTHRNLRADLEDIGSVFDGDPDLEFRAATKPLELERSGLTYQRVPPATASRTATPTERRKRSTWSSAGAGG